MRDRMRSDLTSEVIWGREVWGRDFLALIVEREDAKVVL